MPQALCILHANCQGDALRPLLENTPAFARFFRIQQYVNYTSQQIADADLGRCTLLLHQYLAPRWGELSTEQMLKRLPTTSCHLELPNLFFKGYWPFWINSKNNISFADSLLESLLAKGLTPIEVLQLYLRGESSLIGDVASIAESSLAQEQNKEADKPIRCAHIVRARWQEKQLFITVNHPGKELVCHVATSILQLLGLGSLPDSVRKAYVHPHEDFWLPIHPILNTALGLPFATPERRYRIFDQKLTHRDYTICYLACRKHGVKDLLTLLRNLSSGNGLPHI